MSTNVFRFLNFCFDSLWLLFVNSNGCKNVLKLFIGKSLFSTKFSASITQHENLYLLILLIPSSFLAYLPPKIIHFMNMLVSVMEFTFVVSYFSVCETFYVRTDLLSIQTLIIRLWNLTISNISYKFFVDIFNRMWITHICGLEFL